MLQSLKSQADEFVSTRGPDDHLAVGIVSIGFNMVMTYEPHTFVKKLEGWKEPPIAQDKSRFEQQFVLTTEGEPVATVEHAANIANAGDNVHVISLVDWDPTKRNQIKPDHVTTDGTQFHDFKIDSRPGYKRITHVRNANCT